MENAAFGLKSLASSIQALATRLNDEITNNATTRTKMVTLEETIAQQEKRIKELEKTLEMIIGN